MEMKEIFFFLRASNLDFNGSFLLFGIYFDIWYWNLISHLPIPRTFQIKILIIFSSEVQNGVVGDEER